MMKSKKKLSVKQTNELLSLFKHIVSQKRENKSTALKHLNDDGINIISEAIYNLLYNPDLNRLLSNPQRKKLKSIINPNVRHFEDIAKKKIPTSKRRHKIIQSGSGIGAILMTLLPILSSFLLKK